MSFDASSNNGGTGTVENEEGEASSSAMITPSSPSPLTPTHPTQAPESHHHPPPPSPPFNPLNPLLRENDHFLLHFADGRQIFAQALSKWKAKKSGTPPCKINKRTYGTHHLIGLPYGTVLEVGLGKNGGLIPLPEGEGLLPVLLTGASGASGGEAASVLVGGEEGEKDGENGDGVVTEENKQSDSNFTTPTPHSITPADNRHFTDDNTSQSLTQPHISSLLATRTPGSHIIAALISNSSTFASKTTFSQAKYIHRKQLKYQPRCRIVKITPETLCRAMFAKEPRKISNLREDTLGYMLSLANITAGSKALIMDTAVMGLITASATRKMGGYGTILSLYCGQQPSYLDVVNRMNFSFGERMSLKWVHAGEVFGDSVEKERQMGQFRVKNDETGEEELVDLERRDREALSWPPPLQPHTRAYLLKEVKDERKRMEFLNRRSARFARKLTRHSMLELREMMDGCRGDREEEEEVEQEAQDSEVVNVYDGFGGDNGGSGVQVGQDTTMEDADECKDLKESSTRIDDNDDGNGNGMDNGKNNNNSNNNPDMKCKQQQKKKQPQIRQCDSLIIATKYDPTSTLLRLLPYLAPSCPFVVYHEFLEPLLETFRHLQSFPSTAVDSNAAANNATSSYTSSTGNASNPSNSNPPPQKKNIAINLRLTDTWFREYQILEGRTHPNMVMSQNGGYLLMGTKLCPKTGTNEMDEERVRELRAKMGPRRGVKGSGKKGSVGGGGVGKRNSGDGGGGENLGGGKKAKR